MGNTLPFFKRSNGKANEDKLSSVEVAASVTPRTAGSITLKHAHRPLDQSEDESQLHSPTTTTLRPVNVSCEAEPKEISDQDEKKTLEPVEQSQVLHVAETDVSTLPVEGQPQTLLLTSVAVGDSGTGKTGHYTGTGEDGSSGTGKTGHSTWTKTKRKTATNKRQHGELTYVCREPWTETYCVCSSSAHPPHIIHSDMTMLGSM